jgi:hypothetical protein
MKKLILYSLIALILTVLTLLASGIVKKMDRKALIEKKISSFPAFTYLTLTGSSFNSRNLTEGPVMIVRFNPDCEHCEYEISEIAKSSIPSSGIKILLISDAERDRVVSFLDPFDLPGDKNIIPLLDTAGTFGEVFGTDFIPSIYIYGRDLSLIKSLQGEYKIETILNYLPHD